MRTQKKHLEQFQKAETSITDPQLYYKTLVYFLTQMKSIRLL